MSRLVLAPVIGVLVVVLQLLGGCASGDAQRARFAKPEVVPGYAETASRFNARVARLDRVWSRVNITIHSPKEGGGTSVDHAEGYLQLEQPDKTSLSIMKVGATYFYLGSNVEGYWWLDMSDSEHKTALYGRHEEATPELVAELGLPVHPRELLELFGITPLPVRGAREVVEPGTVDWDESRGMLRVRTGAMWGQRVLWLDPVTMAPQRVELLGRDGRVRAACDMGRYISAPVRGDGRVPPKLASQYKVVMPPTGARATLELYGAENKPINQRAFDFENLVESYGIDEVYLLRPQGSRE